MPDARAVAVVQERDRLDMNRGLWKTQWQEISDFMLPHRNRFTTKFTPGQDLQRRIVDNTAQRAVARFAAGLQNVISPKAIRWFELQASDKALNDDKEVGIWLDDTARRISEQLASPVTNFYPNQYEYLLEIAAFGTGVMSVQDRPGLGPIIRNHFLGDCVFEEGADGFVNRIFVTFQMSGWDIAEQFDLSNLTSNTRKVIQEQPHVKRNVVWAVMPRGKRGAAAAQRAKPFTSMFVLEMDRAILEVKGFDSFPFVVWRWSKGTGETYGRGIGSEVLPDVKMLQQQEITNLKGSQKLVDPPLLLPNGATIGRLRTTPGAVNHLRAGLRPDDGPRPLVTGGNQRVGELKSEQTRENIRKSFFLDILTLPGVTAADGDIVRMSATEALLRKQDQIGVLGPIASRGEPEHLSPVIERVVLIMARNNMLLPVPAALAEGGIDIVYTSPLAVAQNVGDVNAFAQAVANSAQMAQFDPGALDWADFTEAGLGSAERLNVPAKWTKSRGEITAVQRERAAAQQRVADASAVVDETQALKNAAGAQEIVSP